MKDRRWLVVDCIVWRSPEWSIRSRWETRKEAESDAKSLRRDPSQRGRVMVWDSSDPDVAAWLAEGGAS